MAINSNNINPDYVHRNYEDRTHVYPIRVKAVKNQSIMLQTQDGIINFKENNEETFENAKHAGAWLQECAARDKHFMQPDKADLSCRRRFEALKKYFVQLDYLPPMQNYKAYA